MEQGFHPLDQLILSRGRAGYEDDSFVAACSQAADQVLDLEFRGGGYLEKERMELYE